MSKHQTGQSSRTISVRRREEHVEIYAAELVQQDPSLSMERARGIARKRIDDESKLNPLYDKVFLATKPSSRSVPRKGVSEIAEIGAIMGIPEVAGLREHLETSGSTRKGNWSLVVAVLFKMTYFGRPDFNNTRRQFIPGSAVEWAYGYPEGPETDAGEYFALRTISSRHCPGRVVHVNLDLLDRIASRKDLTTGKPIHPNMFKFCSVDGSLIPANVTQSPPYAPTKRQRKIIEREIAGPRRPMVQMVWHGKGAGAEPSDDPLTGWRKKCFGYNLVVISCMDTGLPIIWQLMPATGNERAAVLEMLEALYILRPSFPMEYLVGDGLYGNSREFVGDLYSRYGVHMVFPVHGSMSKQTARTHEGVPVCNHGMMNLDKTGEVWGSTKRRHEGLKPGALPPEGKGSRPRLRWICPKKEGAICAPRNTYLPDDWHLNTYLPHAGSSEKAALRSVLLSRRNNSESLFSQIKHSGPGSEWPGRSRWADDDGMRMGLSLALMQITARRVVHESGAYDRALEETDAAGYLTSTEKRRLHKKRATTSLDNQDECDWWGAPAMPPSTLGSDVELPIDREYLIPSLLEFSDRPDKPSTGEGDEPPEAGLAAVA